ncbi:MAG TPA: TolC family protein, partial [Rickettsiales bacterium]|nr:TolC family protein [Rickettsiales bacterium]
EEYRNIVGLDDVNLIEPKILSKDFNRGEVVQIALSNNQQLKSSYYEYLSAKSAHNVEKSKFSPTLSVIASANRQSNVVYLDQRDLTTKSVYLNLSVPIFQRGVEYANVSKASHERSAAKEEYEITQDNVRKEVLKSLDEYNLALEMAKSSKNLSNLAQERLSIYEKRAQKRLVDRIELLRAQIEYNERLVRKIEAEMKLVKSYYKIKYFLGEL